MFLVGTSLKLGTPLEFIKISDNKDSTSICVLGGLERHALCGCNHPRWCVEDDRSLTKKRIKDSDKTASRTQLK